MIWFRSPATSWTTSTWVSLWYPPATTATTAPTATTPGAWRHLCCLGGDSGAPLMDPWWALASLRATREGGSETRVKRGEPGQAEKNSVWALMFCLDVYYNDYTVYIYIYIIYNCRKSLSIITISVVWPKSQPFKLPLSLRARQWQLGAAIFQENRMPGRSRATSEVIGAFGLGPRQCLGAKFGDLETEGCTRQTDFTISGI